MCVGEQLGDVSTEICVGKQVVSSADRNVFAWLVFGLERIPERAPEWKLPLLPPPKKKKSGFDR